MEVRANTLQLFHLPFPRTFSYFFSIIPNFLEDFSFSLHPTLSPQYFFFFPYFFFAVFPFFTEPTDKNKKLIQLHSSLQGQANEWQKNIEKCVYCFWEWIQTLLAIFYECREKLEMSRFFRGRRNRVWKKISIRKNLLH